MPAPPLARRLRHALEAFLVYAAYFFFRLPPPAVASALGGKVMRVLGPCFPSSATARRNLAAAFPEKSGTEREEILREMWDNLGRIAAEYAHLPRLAPYIEVRGEEHLTAARDSGKAHIFCAGHLGNWEIPSIAMRQRGLYLHPVYRRPNNPWVDRFLRRVRSKNAGGLIPKGAAGAREIFSVLKKGGAVGILFDQKLNEGLPVPFFGRDAMTAPAIALFAQRFRCPVHPVRVERLAGIRFRMTVLPALPLPDTGDREADARALLLELNRLLEEWVRARPAQWLWTHRRWPE